MKDKAKQIDLSMNDLPVKTLEITWSASSYQFFFIASPLVEDIVSTKRKFFRKISTLFNPLGFVTPFVIRARTLMREVWISGNDWDDQLTENILDKTKKWRADLQNLGNIKVGRCLRRSTTQVLSDRSFHQFSNGREDASAAVMYERNVYEDGSYQLPSLPLNLKWGC